MSALFLDLLEGLDTLCQTGTAAPSLDSVRQTIATSFNPFEDTVDWIIAGRAPLARLVALTRSSQRLATSTTCVISLWAHAKRRGAGLLTDATSIAMTQQSSRPLR